MSPGVVIAGVAVSLRRADGERHVGHEAQEGHEEQIGFVSFAVFVASC